MNEAQKEKAHRRSLVFCERGVHHRIALDDSLGDVDVVLGPDDGACERLVLAETAFLEALERDPALDYSRHRHRVGRLDDASEEWDACVERTGGRYAQEHTDAFWATTTRKKCITHATD
eukprot:75178-Rhodomonas_salina.1